LFLGSLIYLKTINVVLNTHNARQFHKEFGREVTQAVLGQTRPAVAILAVIVLVALFVQRRRLEFVSATVAVIAFMLFVWVVVQPQFLVVRYWVWIIPGVALAAAFLVSRRPLVIVLVLVAVGSMVFHERATWNTVEVPTSETAALVDAARAQGMRVCGVLHTGVAVLGYTRQPERGLTIAQIAKCDFVIGFYVPHALNRLVRLQFPYNWKIPGWQSPAYIYSRKPEAELTAAMPRRRDDLRTHARTFPS